MKFHGAVIQARRGGADRNASETAPSRGTGRRHDPVQRRRRNLITGQQNFSGAETARAVCEAFGLNAIPPAGSWRDFNLS
ncbi:hypothetical protein FJ936_23295 [Mesorhizobium sp. B2-4-13]|nr:hypothetical protein FJ936_23295 [Mesorhizobium sp. B2-4-13]